MSAYSLYNLQEKKTAGGTQMTITCGHTINNSKGYSLLDVKAKLLKRQFIQILKLWYVLYFFRFCHYILRAT